MSELRFRILNVFTVEGQRLSGNPLCVFEDGRGLEAAQMQALARQFNLSETTFILPPESKDATAKVRIFTPTFEMPFAGHPTLGTAHVASELSPVHDRVILQMKAGLVAVVRSPEGSEWTLRTAKAPATRDVQATDGHLAAMLGLRPEAVAERPMWVDTGAEQLVIRLARPEDVREAKANASLLAEHAWSKTADAAMAYVWAPLGPPGALDGGEVIARFFFLSDGNVVEDPATGSACANLGGYLRARGARGPALPLELRVHQGERIDRPSLLRLRIEEDAEGGRIFVSGRVEELGRGTIRL
jgi:PhzF family phenazine biosynthesis protein